SRRAERHRHAGSGVEILDTDGYAAQRGVNVLRELRVGEVGLAQCEFGIDGDEGAAFTIEFGDPIQIMLCQLPCREYTRAKSTQLLSRGEFVQLTHRVAARVVMAR